MACATDSDVIEWSMYVRYANSDTDSLQTETYHGAVYMSHYT